MVIPAHAGLAIDVAYEAVLGAEQVVQRPTRAQPRVGKAATGGGGRSVVVAVNALVARRRALGPHDRRTLVGGAQDQVEAVELAVLGVLHDRGDHRPHRLELLLGPDQPRIAQLRRQRRHVGGRHLDGVGADWAALELVAVEQVGGRPARQDGSQFPPDVHGIADAGVEAVATPGRVEVGGVAGEEHAPAAIRVGQLHAGTPRIGCDDLDRDLAELIAEHVPYERLRVGSATIGFDADGDAPPPVDQVEPTNHARLHRVQHPVVHRRAMGDARGQLGRAKDDVEVGPVVARPLQRRADRVADHAPRTIAPQRVPGVHDPHLARRILDDRLDAVCVLCQRDDLGAGDELDQWEVVDRLAHD